MSKPRSTDAKFRVCGAHVDGKSEGTLTIEAPKASGTVLVTYRPLHGRAYTILLAEAAEMIAWRVAKKEAR